LLLLIFLNLSVLLGLGAAVLHFSDITSDPKWERLCGQALLFTLVPVVVPVVMLGLRVSFPPIIIVASIWVLLALLIYLSSKKEQDVTKAEIQNQGAWKCAQCGEVNQRLIRLCWKCGKEKPHL
jgi:hypothetical protein